MAGYETEGQAREAADFLINQVRIATAGAVGPAIGAAARETQSAYLRGNLKSVQVELGAFDEAIAGWLAGFEPETVQAVVRWINEAYLAGRKVGREESE